MTGKKKLAIAVVTAALICASLAYVFAANLQQPAHGIGVLKSANSFAYIGDMVEYQIRVYNPSDYDQYNINLTDPMLGLNITTPFLKAGNTTGITYTLYREVLETDPSPLINEVFVEAIDSTGAYSSSSTQAITTIAERLITITKVGPEHAHKGEAIEYTIMVNNTGDDDLFGVVVEDEMLGFSWQGDLSTGETNTFNLTFTVPCNVWSNLTNTAIVWAQLNETTFFAEVSWTTQILRPCIYPLSKGYWKNHPEKWPVDWMEVGDVNYTKEETINILKEANAKDATRMLAAQLITAKLNRLSGAGPEFNYCDEPVDINTIIEDADEFLSECPIGSAPQDEERGNALQLKDILDRYNNSECD